MVLGRISHNLTYIIACNYNAGHCFMQRSLFTNFYVFMFAYIQLQMILYYYCVMT